jgi:hypothetical protein
MRGIVGGVVTPTEDTAFREVTEMLGDLTMRLGLADSITGWKGFLPDDPQRIIDPRDRTPRSQGKGRRARSTKLVDHLPRRKFC